MTPPLQPSSSHAETQWNEELQWVVEPHRPCSWQTPSRKGRGIMSQVESSPQGLPSVKYKKNKNKDKDLCIQIFMLASNIVGQWQATLAIKYELTQKGTFSFLLFSQLSHLHRETFYPLCSPAAESDRPGNSSVGIKVPISLPAKSKAKFPLCQGSQLISCKLGWAVRASFPKQANAFSKRQLGVYCIITWPLRG